MALSRAAQRCFALAVVALFLVVTGTGTGTAEAYPSLQNTPPTPTAAAASNDDGVRLAKRRRRRRRRRSSKPKSQQQEPKAESTDKPTSGDNPAPAAGAALRRGGRVEFDGRLVQGQTAKSGAIYLFARKRSDLRSMVSERTSYRKEILRTIYPKDEYEGPSK